MQTKLLTNVVLFKMSPWANANWQIVSHYTINTVELIPENIAEHSNFLCSEWLNSVLHIFRTHSGYLYSIVWTFFFIFFLSFAQVLHCPCCRYVWAPLAYKCLKSISNFLLWIECHFFHPKPQRHLNLHCHLPKLRRVLAENLSDMSHQ